MGPECSEAKNRPENNSLSEGGHIGERYYFREVFRAVRICARCLASFREEEVEEMRQSLRRGCGGGLRSRAIVVLGSASLTHNTKRRDVWS